VDHLIQGQALDPLMVTYTEESLAALNAFACS